MQLQTRALFALAAFFSLSVAEAQFPTRIYRYPQSSPPRDYFEVKPPTHSAPPQNSVAAPPAGVSIASSTRNGPNIITKAAIISSPGSYILGANLTAATDATTAVILITSPDVTVDLAGFSIWGRDAKSPDCSGVAIFADRVEVRNGSIAGFNADNQCGVIVGADVTGFALSDLRIAECETGIVLNPDNADGHPTQSGRIEKCAINHAAVGLLGFSSTGISIKDCQISGCSARHDMQGEGSGLLLKGSGYLVEDCNVSGNAHGIRIDADNSAVSHCVASDNRNTGGYISGKGCSFDHSDFSGNGVIGLVINSVGCSIRDCAMNNNGGNGLTLDTGDGTAASQSTLVRNCIFTGNSGDGLSDKGKGNALVEGCHADGNGGATLTLQQSDAYQNCFLGAPAKGGKDAGGNSVVGK